MRASAGKKRGLTGTGIIAAVVGVLVILIVVTAAIFFFRYRKGGGLHADASASLVAIAQPGNLAEFPAGIPILVEVAASGAQPFTSTELWINGVLEGVQAAPEGGLASLASQFAWVPPEGGNYSLVARAVPQDGNPVTSAAVIVFIDPAGYADQAAAGGGGALPVVFPNAPEDQPAPPAPGPGDDPAPAHGWQGSPGDWLNSLTNDSAPAAPGLAVTADGCSLKVDIHDLSDNEEGFALYRQTTNNPDWVHVTDLASHTGQGWIEYTDPALPGGITYYASAFNASGEASSNLALVNIDPQTCPAPEPSAGVSSLYLEVKHLSIAGLDGGLYCYTNRGGGQWSRWPGTGFLMPGDIGLSAPLLVRPLILSGISEAGIGPGLQTLDLKIECWGWQAGKLLSLGSIHEAIDLANPQAIHAALSGATFDIAPGIHALPVEAPLKLGVGASSLHTVDLDPHSVENLGYVPESDQMPKLGAWVTYDPEVCKLFNLEPSYKEMHCYPFPGFNAGPGGVNPQPYLVWYVFNGTCDAYPDKECFSEDWWVSFANLYPHPYYPRVQFYIESTLYDAHGNQSGSIANSLELDQQGWRIVPGDPFPDPFVCHNGNRILNVYLDAETSLGHFTSSSPPVTVPCPVPLGDTVNIEVTFASLDLENIDDSEWSPNTADNPYGQFTARLNGQLGPVLLAGWWGGVDANGENPFDLSSGGTNGWISELGNGLYNLADWQLCLQGPGSCDTSVATPYQYNNNKLVVQVRSGDALLLLSELFDYDETSGDDAMCNTSMWVGPRDLQAWAVTENESYTLVQPEGDATCNLVVILNAVKADQ